MPPPPIMPKRDEIGVCLEIKKDERNPHIIPGNVTTFGIIIWFKSMKLITIKRQKNAKYTIPSRPIPNILKIITQNTAHRPSTKGYW